MPGPRDEYFHPHSRLPESFHQERTSFSALRDRGPITHRWFDVTKHPTGSRDSPDHRSRATFHLWRNHRTTTLRCDATRPLPGVTSHPTAAAYHLHRKSRE